jgi:hypothetical protein
MDNQSTLQRHWKKLATGAALTTLLAAGSCDDATIASNNLSKAADNFEIDRRIVFLNGITDNYLLSIEGKCNINVDEAESQLEVTCKTGENEAGESLVKKHFLGLSDNVTYFVEQLDSVGVSTYHYRVTFKPQAIVPDIDFRGDLEELVTPSPQP